MLAALPAGIQISDSFRDIGDGGDPLADIAPDRIPAQLNLGMLQQKRGFALFQAAETNEAAAAAELKKSGAVFTVKAVKAFMAVDKETEAAIASKMTSKQDKGKFAAMREAALYLLGDSWQRMCVPEDKIPAFRKRAVAAFESYLKAFPKGKYAPQSLVKIGTIHTAEKDMESSQKAFERLQTDFPESDEAKNSVPRLAKTLIDMGLRAEGVAQYKQMLSSSGKFTAPQFLAAGDALLEARSWDTAQAAFAKAADLVKDTTNNVLGVTARSLLGQAKALAGAQRLAEAHDLLEKFIGDEKLSRSALVVDAYHMLVDVASEEGRTEKDDTMRGKYFNAAVGAIKKVRRYRPDQADQDMLDLLSGDVLVRKMEAEEAMNLKEQARETCGRAVVTFQAFLMAHEPTPDHPADKMTPQQLVNLERCYSTALPLMAKLGQSQSELVLKYGAAYAELFPDGKHRTAVQNAVNQAKADR